MSKDIKPFKKVLIANRGEIAVRIIRSCKELGIETVSVHSTADEDSLHVKMADESVCIGPAKSAQSYLNIPQLLSAADITGADAIHPGYGFLSEDDEFSEMCAKWGITFIGPSPECVRKMGDKIESKILARNAGVPTLEPIHVKGKALEEIKAEADKMGYPILIKASAGGGGRGMKRIESASELPDALARLEAEAKSAFGDGTLFIEKYIQNPRHIEIQILADKHGNVLHLGERDCTIQRRFQKILEESPSPVLPEKTRQEMADASIRLAKVVNYDSVGTVEYLYDQDDGRFYFMEMNTRIQVEHPVTEQRTGIDLIAEQIQVAMGHKLTIKQKDINFRGHVIEFRINAEDPKTGMPSPGFITHYHRPGGLGVRSDDFIYTGYTVPPYYDSMVSKIIITADSREKCLARGMRALTEVVVSGIQTNIDLHKKIITHPDFISNNYSTNFLTKIQD
ncbi:MAG: acetyl-CoA carboxylase biotin carboxylase subunit [Proteobacteria bacterium]|jgi:acetyl-CoA carboxylase biotin carboxylase subunit|nr:acetyl-CoA carboxylase biotin carboxylase subunit [Pseudomonadota bacterium]